MDFNVGDIVRMKKQHPCGGYEWKILRCGMDFRIECMTCQRQVMLPRVKFEKRFKKLVAAAPPETKPVEQEGVRYDEL